MDTLEFNFIIIEGICILIEIGLEIYSIVENKKLEKKLLNKLATIEIENSVIEKYLK